MARLGLGAAQFGLNYGLTNRHGQTDYREVVQILATAAENRVSVLDTAPVYGKSERVIGNALEGHMGSQFRIVTKTPIFHKDLLTVADADALEKCFLKSLETLRRPNVYGLLIHHCQDAVTAGSETLFERMELLRAYGLVQKIGVSAYGPDEVGDVVERHAIDLVQAPFNVVDQRLRTSGCFERLRRYGIELHTRSAFLQGGLLVDPSLLPAHFATHLWRFRKFHDLSVNAGVSPVAVALQFVLRCEEIDSCVVGVTTVAELIEVLQAVNADVPEMDLRDLASDDENLTHPGRWKQ